MEWPNTPVESTPPEEFQPPFCSHEDCPSNDPSGRQPFRFRKDGWFTRKCDNRRVPCYRCKTCGGRMSLQTFAVSYYLKRPELAAPVAAGLVAGSAHRQLARSLGCAPSTVTRLSARLGRHAMLLLARGLDRLPALPEPIVYDHFETFVVSQDLPCGLGTPVGRFSWFNYGLDAAPHRRSGRARPERKPRRHADPRPRPGAYRRAFRATLDRLLEKAGAARLELISDDHPAYRGELRRHPERHRVLHRIFANPKKRPSRQARERDRWMFPVDLLHGLMRHSLAHHGRRTIAFGRRHNAIVERGFLALVWRNWVKGRSERKPDRTTPAMWVGLAHEPWNWPRVMGRRLFAWRQPLSEDWARIYRRALITPEIGRNRRHALVRAF